MEGPITEKARRRAGPRNHEPKNEGMKINPRPAYRDLSSKTGHNQLQMAKQVLKSYRGMR